MPDVRHGPHGAPTGRKTDPARVFWSKVNGRQVVNTTFRKKAHDNLAQTVEWQRG